MRLPCCLAILAGGQTRRARLAAALFWQADGGDVAPQC